MQCLLFNRSYLFSVVFYSSAREDGIMRFAVQIDLISAVSARRSGGAFDGGN